MNKELDSLFDQKIVEIKETEKKESQRIKEINQKYADAYISLVKDVIKSMHVKDEIVPIHVKNEIIGNYLLKGDGVGYEEMESNAILKTNQLDIVLEFNEYVGSYINIEDGYDEELLNKILGDSNISVKRYSGEEGISNSHIDIVYKRK